MTESSCHTLAVPADSDAFGAGLSLQYRYKLCMRRGVRVECCRIKLYARAKILLLSRPTLRMEVMRKVYTRHVGTNLRRFGPFGARFLQFSRYKRMRRGVKKLSRRFLRSIPLLDRP